MCLQALFPLPFPFLAIFFPKQRTCSQAINELAEELKTKISEVDVLLEQMRSPKVCANKQSESYSCLLSNSLEVSGKGKANRRDNKTAKNRKRKERRKIKDKKRFCDAIESRKQYIKNLSNEQLTDVVNKLLYYRVV